MLRTPTAALGLVLLLALGACDKHAGSVSCGIDAMTGPLVVKQSLAKGAGLALLPGVAPAGLPIRLVAGPAWHGSVVRDTLYRWHITLHGTVDSMVHVGYGVLVVDYDNRALGVLAYDAQPIRGATSVGDLAVGNVVVPVYGVQLDPATFQRAACPFFPDSLR